MWLKFVKHRSVIEFHIFVNKMNLDAIIPARSGSKGIANKNIREFKGKPLLAWSIEQALSVKKISKVIVSTEDEKIAEIAQQFGADVPFLRPKNLASDTSPILESILHYLDRTPNTSDILLLQPTSPLRRVIDIENIINLREKNKRESAVSVSTVNQYPRWMFSIKKGFMYNFSKEKNIFKRRQELEELFILNGALYLSSKKHLIGNKSFISEETLPYVMPEEYSIDIDVEKDWEYGEFLFDKLN